MAEAQLGTTPANTTDPTTKLYVDGLWGRGVTAAVATSESTSSTTYADLTTTTDSVTVTVSSTGIALVFLSSVVTYTSGTSVAAYLGVAVSGATTQAAADQYSLGELIPAQAMPLSGVIALTGLTAGSNTFKMKYRMNTGTAAYANRRITVIPL